MIVIMILSVQIVIICNNDKVYHVYVSMISGLQMDSILGLYEDYVEILVLWDIHIYVSTYIHICIYT